MQRIGRRRLPPAKVLWRMARWMEWGSVVAAGSRRSKAASVRAAPVVRRDFTSVDMLDQFTRAVQANAEKEQCDGGEGET